MRDRKPRIGRAAMIRTIQPVAIQYDKLRLVEDVFATVKIEAGNSWMLAEDLPKHFCV